MVNKILLKNTTVSQRKILFNKAYNVAQIEFGKLSENAKKIIANYVYGKIELSEAKKKILKLYTKEHDEKQLNPIKDNLLNITNYRELKSACAAITTIELMEIDTEDFIFNYEEYKQVHERIFLEIYPWAGVERTVTMQKKMSILGNRTMEFDCENINDSMEKIFNGINDITLMGDIDKAMTNIFKEINYIKWETLPLEQKCALCARLTGLLWISHPFIEGNTTMALYTIIRFSEQNNFDFRRKIVREQHEKIDIRRCILLASLQEDYDVNFLASIYMMSNNLDVSENINCLSVVEEKQSIDELIAEAQKEKKRKQLEDM